MFSEKTLKIDAISLLPLTLLGKRKIVVFSGYINFIFKVYFYLFLSFCTVFVFLLLMEFAL